MTPTSSTTKARATRYVVRPRQDAHPALQLKTRIVMTTSRAAAIAHVASQLIEAAPATLDGMEELLAQGITTEHPGRGDPAADAGADTGAA